VLVESSKVETSTADQLRVRKTRSLRMSLSNKGRSANPGSPAVSPPPPSPALSGS